MCRLNSGTQSEERNRSMNASRMLKICEYIEYYEKKFKIQSILSELNGHLENLAGQPANPTMQTSYSESLDKVEETLDKLSSEMEPRELVVLKEINGLEFFSKIISSDVRQWVADNPASLSVAQQKLSAFVSKRQKFIEQTLQLAANLTAVGVEVEQLSEGQAEIGFLLPRAQSRFEESEQLR